MERRIHFSLRRVGLIAGQTFREAVRQRLFRLLLLLALALTAGSGLLRECNFGTTELKFLTDLGLGALGCLGSLLALAAATQLFFGELESRTALTLLAKPVLRGEFVAGKFLGAWLVAGAFCALVTALLCLVLGVRARALSAEEATAGPVLVRYGDIVIAGSLQWVKCGVIVAATLLVASFATTALFTLGAGLLLLIAGHLQHLVREPGAAGTPVHFGTALLGLLLPDYHLFNVGELIAAGRPLSLLLAGRIVVYGLVYALVLLVLAARCFRHREL